MIKVLEIKIIYDDIFDSIYGHYIYDILTFKNELYLFIHNFIRKSYCYG